MNGGFQNRRSLYIEGQQGGEKGVLVAPCLIDGGDQHPLNLDFLRGAVLSAQSKSPALSHLGIQGYTHLPAHTFCQLFLQS